MAYKYLSNKYCANAQAWHDNLRQLLLDAGWTQHDQVAAQYTIMKSDGSAADGRFMYLKILMTSTAMTLYTNWNAGTHTSIGGSIPVGVSVTAWGGSTTNYIYADLDGVIGWVVSAGTYLSNSFFGCLRPTTMDSAAFHTVTTAAVTGGGATPVSIEVASSAQFLVGARYCLVDTANGKRAPLLCTAIADSTHVTVSGLTNGGVYAAGSSIGTSPYPVMVVGPAPANTYSVQMGHPSVAAGLIGLTAGGQISRISNTPSSTENVYAHAIAQPMLGVVVGDKRIYDLELLDAKGTTPWGGFLLGSSPLAKVMQSAVTTILGNSSDGLICDVQAFGQLDSGTSSGSNSATTLNDTSKAWTVNQFAGKALVLTAGPEAGQISKIISNTATQLTVNALAITPTTNTYIIVDLAYRLSVVGTSIGGSAAQLLLREGV